MTAAWLGWRDVVSRPVRALLAFMVVGGCAAVFGFAELTERARDAAVAGELDRVAAPLRIVSAAPGAAGAAPRMLDTDDEARVRAAAGGAARDVEPWLAFDTEVGGVRARLVGAAPTSAITAVLAADGVGLGAALAERLGALPGSPVTVVGQPRRVTVLAARGDADDATAFVALEAAQRALGVPGAISELRVRLWPGGSVGELQARLADALPGATVLRVDRGRVADVEIATTVRAHHIGVALVTAIAALTCLAIAAFLDAAERRLELASLVALGATRRDVVVALASRSAAIAALGGGGGALAGAIVAAIMGDAAAVGRATVPVVAVATAAAGFLGLAASIPTATLAASRDPVRDIQDAAA